MADPNVEAVREQLKQRSEVGLAKYGVDTTREDFTPREWVQHLQEELMDAAIYAERLKQELGRPDVIPALDKALDLMTAAKANIHHSYQKTHVALRDAIAEIHRARILAGG